MLPLLMRTGGSGEVELMEAGFMSSGWERQDLAQRAANATDGGR